MVGMGLWVEGVTEAEIWQVGEEVWGHEGWTCC